MKKLFISQPMKNKTDEEILAVREQAIKSAKELLGEEVEVIDSFFQSAPVDARPMWFLGKSIELLSTADIVYFADFCHCIYFYGTYSPLYRSFGKHLGICG